MSRRPHIVAEEAGCSGPRGPLKLDLYGAPRDVESIPGERLTMSDGSIWFHPYNGGAPTQLQPAQQQQKGGSQS